MKYMHLRAVSAFLVSLFLVLGAANTQGDPAQSPLFISGASVPGSKPNIMLMVDSSGSMSTRVVANNDTRINIAKTAAKNLVDQLTPLAGAQPTVRLALTTYNSGNGGKLLYPLVDLDAAQATSVKSKISTLNASGVTPLATTLSDIGYYFATGNATANLTLHPGGSSQSLPMTTIFARSDSQSSGLVGFDPALTCTVTSTGVTPANMPANYTPQCPCSNFVAGGAATSSAATDTVAVPPIQMLVINSQPTVCTQQASPACANQTNYGMCASGTLSDCPTCTNTTNTGTTESITFNPSPSSVAVNSNTQVAASETPNIWQRYPALNLASGMGSTCSLTNYWWGQKSIYGIANGTCRICALLDETTTTNCAWSSGGGSGCSNTGDQRCDNWSRTGCQATNDTWVVWNHTGHDDAGHSCQNEGDAWCTDWHGHSCHSYGTACHVLSSGTCACMNHAGCANAGATWSSWNHTGSDDRGYSCATEGHNWCNNWTSGNNAYCRDWGTDCHQSSGTCSAITPDICTCSTQTNTKCAVATLDVTVGTGGSGGGGGNNGGTGGTLGSGSLCFNPSKYYTVQYNGSPDIMGPYSGAQFNWYFLQSGFTEGSLELPTSTSQSNCVATNTPIQNYCQKSFTVLISDGLPNGDRNVSDVLKDYTGDCAAGLCDKTANTRQLPGTSTPLISTGSYCDKTHGGNNMTCQNGTKVGRAYETSGSDYLDDVAKALFEMDLRPDLGVTEKSTAHPPLKNNLVTYAIGFNDPSLIASSVLSDAANVGGGRFFFASDAADLASALSSVVNEISAQTVSSSSASAATNSTQVGANSLIYQSKFDSGGWFGDLLALPLSSDGSLGTASWNASEHIPNDGAFTGGDYNASSDGRTILTYNPAAAGTKGTRFRCANLGAAQLSALGIGSCSSTTDQGVWRLNYLRGDKTHEVSNLKRVLQGGETETRSTNTAIAVFRNRTRLDKNNSYTVAPDPWLLGDVVNSNPVYVSNDDYIYGGLPEGGGANGYGAFRSSSAYTGRRPMLYVGANDGMLHGFDASPGMLGKEIVAYVPNGVYGNLTNLTSPGYIHHYSVDGSPAVGDAYLSSATSSNHWRTILVGTTGAGGQAVFALDVTDPGAAGSSISGFSGSSALWEFSNASAPNSTDLTTDTASLRGFQNNLGYTLPRAAIVRLHDGSWAALVANGYSSANNRAVLYLVDINTGQIIRALNPVNADEGSFTSANGLSSPFAADVNGDRITDYIYAGDLRGNLWKFDVTNATASNWSVANSGRPLYVACDQEMTLPCPQDHRQPITSRPVVGLGGANRPSGSYMVYFGTGQYFESGDNNTTQTQTFYGIVDKSVVVPTGGTTTRGTLVNQTTTTLTNLRTTTTNACANDGWFTDLTESGERVTTFPRLRGERVIFTTMIPPTGVGNNSQDPCVGGTVSSGSGWLMELSAACGTAVDTNLPPWDINGDNVVDNNDLVNGKSPSGVKSTVGIPTMPAIVDLPPSDGGPQCTGGACEVKYSAGSAGTIDKRLESHPPSGLSGRQSWYQIR